MEHASHRVFAIRLAALVALTPFAIDTYLPAIPALASELDAPIPAVNMGISAFLLGFALGQLTGGPLSDRIGRRPIALSGLTLFILSSIVITFAISVDTFLIARFVQALGGGAASVVVGALVRDRYKGQQSAQTFATIGMIMMIAPLIAPAVGSVILAISKWQYIFVFLAAYAALMLGMVLKNIPAALPDTEQVRNSLLKHYIHSYSQVFRQTRSLPFLFSQAFVSGILLAFVTNASFMFLTYLDVGQAKFPFFFAAIPLASALAGRINISLLNTIDRRVVLRWSAVAQFLITVTFCIYSATTTPTVWPTLSLICATIATVGFAYPNNLSLYLDYHGSTGGTANAIFGCATFAAGALLGGISNAFFDGTLLPIAITIAASSLFSLLLVYPATQTKTS